MFEFYEKLFKNENCKNLPVSLFIPFKTGFFCGFTGFSVGHDSGETGADFDGGGNEDTADGDGDGDDDDDDGVVDCGGDGVGGAIVSSSSSRQVVVGGGGDDGVVSLRGIPAIVLNP